MLGLFSWSSSASAEERKAGDIPQGRVFSDQDNQAAWNFWTDENLKNARPLPLPQISPEDRPQGSDNQLDQKADLQLPQLYEETIAAAARGDSTKTPYKYAGKLFFTKWNGTPHYCTAASVGDPSVVLTAAHCVIDPDSGTLNTNFEFREGYSGGNGVRRTPDCVLVNPNWSGASGQWTRTQYDYAFFKMRQPSSGQLPLRVNWSYTYAASLGYPAAIDNGEYIQVVTGPVAKVNLPVRVFGMKVYDDRYTAGISGGPWLGDFQEGTSFGNYAISVNSATYSQEPGVVWVYGPYFDSSTSSLFRRVRQGCR